jgi:GNAT superfamily N-acetyltransferase
MNAVDQPRAVVTLDDDTVVTVRPIDDRDGALILALYDALSDETRYRRFMTVRGPLNEAGVRFFTHTDSYAHVAFIATVVGPNGNEIPVGAARFIRLEEDPTVAEPAIAVADAWQHRGVGGALLMRLTATAAQRGIATFRAHVLASNDSVRRMIRRWPRVGRARIEGAILTYEVTIGRRVA